MNKENTLLNVLKKDGNMGVDLESSVKLQGTLFTEKKKQLKG